MDESVSPDDALRETSCALLVAKVTLALQRREPLVLDADEVLLVGELLVAAGRTTVSGWKAR